MNVVLFTGGNGNANLIRYIKDLSYVNLSLLINGYDDGLSTGTIRSANYGMLGPSDFRKNFSYILDSYSESSSKIRKIFDHRLNHHECQLLLKDTNQLIEYLQKDSTLSKKTKKFIRTNFFSGAEKLLSYTRDIDTLINFSVGNIIIGGIYEEYKDFNTALNVLTDHFDLNAKLINVSIDDDSKLVAFDHQSTFLSNEADIVDFDGNKPLKEFHLLSLSDFQKLDITKHYNPDEIRKLSSVPNISEKAKQAIIEADLILFGSGTLFSSLLPSYRICRNELISSSAKKVLIVNNCYDNDIQNISLNNYIDLITNELQYDQGHYFDRIMVANRSQITNANAEKTPSNIVTGELTNQDLKHDGYRLWSSITQSLDQTNGKCRVQLILSDNTESIIRKIYRDEVEAYNSSNNSDILFSVNGDPLADYNYYLILDTSGKINLYDIENWINFANRLNFTCIFGYRFYSRRQLILSFKKKFVESKITYYSSALISHIVSFFYFIRFFTFVADPLSGIYLIKANKNFKYRSVPHFLKWINKNKIEILSLPVTYRTFKNVDYIKKSKTLIDNLIKLFF